MTNEQMRADFEAWFTKARGYALLDRAATGGYVWVTASESWEVWQAATLKATEAERERCALVCAELGEYWSAYKDTALLNGDIDLSNAASGEPRAAEAIARAIRMPPTATPQGNQ